MFIKYNEFIALNESNISKVLDLLDVKRNKPFRFSGENWSVILNTKDEFEICLSSDSTKRVLIEKGNKLTTLYGKPEQHYTLKYSNDDGENWRMYGEIQYISSTDFKNYILPHLKK